jgi:hypothetical protein
MAVAVSFLVRHGSTGAASLPTTELARMALRLGLLRPRSTTVSPVDEANCRPEAGGFIACSRRLSEARATSPDCLVSHRPPSGSQTAGRTNACWHPFRVHSICLLYPGCRSFLAQPGATGWDPFGMPDGHFNFGGPSPGRPRFGSRMPALLSPVHRHPGSDFFSSITGLILVPFGADPTRCGASLRLADA